MSFTIRCNFGGSNALNHNDDPHDPARLTLDRIFATTEFRGENVPQVKWLAGGGYTTLQSAKAKKGNDAVASAPATQPPNNPNPRPGNDDNNNPGANRPQPGGVGAALPHSL